jgi:hypothetical protein
MSSGKKQAKLSFAVNRLSGNGEKALETANPAPAQNL